MIEQRASGNVQWCALAVTLALVASACGSDSAEDELSAADAAVMMNEAMGGTQAVQDFLIYVDMVVATDDGPLSYYDDVLERASEGLANPVELAGGFSFSTVDSFGGDVRNAAGEILPTLSLDLGVLATSSENRAAGVQGLAEFLDMSGPDDLPPGLAESVGDDRGMLVEIFTADFSEERTHVGLGDVGAMDLTFVSTIAPGDDLASVYIFGQTLPGDPDEEAELSPHELFAYRWNQGLVAIPGDEGGMDVFLDDNIVAVEGSTLVLTEPKAIAVADAKYRGRLARLQVIEQMATTDFSNPADRLTVPIVEGDDGSDRYLNINRDPDGDFWTFETTEGHGGSSFSQTTPRKIDLDELLFGLRWSMDLAECRRELKRVLAANEPLFGAVSLGTQHEYCDDIPPKKAAGTYGDVHVTTFDGWSYDNQAAGEFLMFDNGTATVQMRSAPWEDSDAVSVVTAIAARVGDHEVSMHQDGSIWIDGEVPTIARGETIAVGDAALLWTGAAWVIVWPDGTELRVSGGGQNIVADDPESTFHPLLMLITVTGENASGMMGSPDDDGRNDWVTRSGEQLDDNIRFDFENFYPTYIDTWRISDDESLFHYETGESTATFTVDGFPRRHYDLADLDPDARADAEAACVEGGIERPEMLDGCILDVALTGDVGFVYDTYLAQSNTSVARTPIDIDVIESPPPAEGQSVVSVGPLTVVFGSDPPVIVPNFPGQWECQAGDGTFTAIARFQETEEQQYEIRVQYLNGDASNDGNERFTLVVQRNSDPIAWMMTAIDPMPGTIDSIELNGSTLTATGTAILNDPYDSTVLLGGANFGSARFEPMTLEVNCDQ